MGPSVEFTLKPFCGPSVKLSFPIRPEKDAEGLLLVAADDAMRKCLDDFVRRRLIRSSFRVLADVSSTASSSNPGGSCRGPPLGLPYVGGDRLAAAPLLGALHESDGSLRLRGSLRSPLAPRPLRLAARVPLGYTTCSAEGMQSQSSSSSQGGPQRASAGWSGQSRRESAWRSRKDLAAGLEGEEVPLALRGILAKSLLSRSRCPQSMEMSSLGEAVDTEFQLLSGPLPSPNAPSLLTAVYRARAHASVSHQIRAHFAEAGCPIINDPYYHPSFNQALRRNAYDDLAPAEEAAVAVQGGPCGGSLGVQLAELEMPDPFRKDRTLRLSLPRPPSSWARLHTACADWPAAMSYLDQGETQASETVPPE